MVGRVKGFLRTGVLGGSGEFRLERIWLNPGEEGTRKELTAFEQKFLEH